MGSFAIWCFVFRFVGEGSLVISWDGEVSPCVALMHSYSCYVMGRKKDIKHELFRNNGAALFLFIATIHLLIRGSYRKGS